MRERDHCKGAKGRGAQPRVVEEIVRMQIPNLIGIDAETRELELGPRELRDGRVGWRVEQLENCRAKEGLR